MTTAAAGTSVGLKRRQNEDSFFLGKNLAVVADGMGGHVAGDVASRTVVDTMSAFDRPRRAGQLAAALGQAVFAANLAMQRRIEAEPALAGMGTTVVGFMWSKNVFFLVNVGDSRAYLLRGRKLTQLTDDHTYGRLLAYPETVPHLTEKISRFLDGRLDGRSPDLAPVVARPGDRLLLCSDGLSSYVGHEAIRDGLAIGAPSETVEALIDLTLIAGAPDNVTVIVIDV